MGTDIQEGQAASADAAGRASDAEAGATLAGIADADAGTPSECGDETLLAMRSAELTPAALPEGRATSAQADDAGDGSRRAVVPERVTIVPWGRVTSTAGEFVVDEEAARLTLEAFAAHGTDLPIDYEHQSLGGRWSSPTGQAPAAGWIKKLEVVAGVGIVACVEWTASSRRQVADRQYRYLSPVAMVRKRDRRLVALHSVGLTNKPAIVGAEPIVNSRSARADTDRQSEEIGMQEQIESLRAVLQLDEQAESPQVLAAAAERIEQLEQRLARRDAEELVARAMQAGKLTEAQREWAVELALSDGDAYERWEGTAPVVVPAGRTQGPADADAGQPGRSAVIASARSEFRGHSELAMLTGEQAYINDALRQRGLELLAD
ncbi:MAG TPA: phage protease [Thiobacillus sp.]|nr:phage protease [Thiobacillus sp.]